MNSGSIFYTASAPFEAARQVNILPHGHPSRYLHGHSFQVRIRFNKDELSAPFPGAEVDTLTSQLQHIVSPLNYSYLNELLDVPPAATRLGV